MRYPRGHKAQSRQRLIDAASKVFRRRGYEGAGVDALAAEAGMTSGAFYSHFRSKEECLAEVVRQSLEASEDIRERGLDELTGQEWLAALLRRYTSEAHWKAMTRGCPIPTLVSELPRCGRRPKRAFSDALRRLAARMDERAGVESEEQHAMVWAALSMAVGSLALSRAVGDRELAREILAAARGPGVEALTRSFRDARA